MSWNKKDGKQVLSKWWKASHLILCRVCSDSEMQTSLTSDVVQLDLQHWLILVFLCPLFSREFEKLAILIAVDFPTDALG